MSLKPLLNYKMIFFHLNLNPTPKLNFFSTLYPHTNKNRSHYMNSDLKRNIIFVVFGYCKIKYRQQHIPHCVINIILKFVSSLIKQKLFNIKYLGQNIKRNYSESEGYLARSNITSILSGIKINFNIFHTIKINVGSQLHLDISLNDGTFKTNMHNHAQTIKTVLGNNWRFDELKSITILILMSRKACCQCYDRVGNRISVYIINKQPATKSICAFYSKLWSGFPIDNDSVNQNEDENNIAEIVTTLDLNFSYDMNQDVSIECDGLLEKFDNFNSLIPIDDCAQGWRCCFSVFKPN